MRQIFFVIILALSEFFSIADAQAPTQDISVVLEKLFTRLATSHEDGESIRINDSIKYIIGSYSESDTAFTHKFANLKYLGQITSKNSRLKILTWNMLLKNSASRYYCYFINNTGEKKQVYKLEGEYSEGPVRNDTIYSDKNWYGALYYDLRPFKKDNQLYWVLLGIDFGNPAVTRKIIDILSFSPNGRIIFGRKLFTSGNAMKYREVLEYSSGAVVSLKFVTDKSIVFDHLVPVSPAYKGNREYYGPDFSYDAYNFEKGIWKFKSDIDVRNKK